jgi:hypothetical protein
VKHGFGGVGDVTHKGELEGVRGPEGRLASLIKGSLRELRGHSRGEHFKEAVAPSPPSPFAAILYHTNILFTIYIY